MNNNPHPVTTAILEKAADIITTKGWTQNNYTDKDGRVCLVEAINQAACTMCSTAQTRIGAADSAAYALRKHLYLSPFNTPNLVAWNDDPQRTAEDVILALKQTAHETNPQ